MQLVAAVHRAMEQTAVGICQSAIDVQVTDSTAVGYGGLSVAWKATDLN